MANEIVKQTNDAVIVNESTGEVMQNFNRNLGEKPIRISIKCKKGKRKDNGKEFNGVKGLKYLDVYGNEGSEDEGKYLGKKNRWLDVHFTMDAFKVDKSEMCNVTDPNDLTTGFLYVKAKYVQSPRKYQATFKRVDDEIQYDEKGNAIIEYPEIWIKGGILGFEPYVSDQDEFDYHEPDIDAEFDEAEPESTDVEYEEPDTEETSL